MNDDNHDLVATISSSSKSAGLWVNAELYETLAKNGAKQEDDIEGTMYVRVSFVNEHGIMLDTFEGNIKLTFNFEDREHPRRWAKGRFDKDTAKEIARHRSYFNPCEVAAEVLDYGKVFLPHPNIVDEDGNPITASNSK